LVDCEGVRPTSEVLRTLRRLEEWNEWLTVPVITMVTVGAAILIITYVFFPTLLAYTRSLQTVITLNMTAAGLGCPIVIAHLIRKEREVIGLGYREGGRGPVGVVFEGTPASSTVGSWNS
jgi:hypothetical protein